jgi:hypothetical protein
MLLKPFNNTIDGWIAAPEKYFSPDLVPSFATSWSRGQLLTHPADGTNYYCEPINLFNHQ